MHIPYFLRQIICTWITDRRSKLLNHCPDSLLFALIRLGICFQLLLFLPLIPSPRQPYPSSTTSLQLCNHVSSDHKLYRRCMGHADGGYSSYHGPESGASPAQAARRTIGVTAARTASPGASHSNPRSESRCQMDHPGSHPT